MKAEIKNALHDAVVAAIKDMGVEQFKKTSFFLSNVREAAEQKIAA